MSKSHRKINLFNEQALDLDTKSLERFLYRMVEHLGIVSELSVRLVTDDIMRDFNHRYAGRDVPTDVLAFPSEQDWPSETSYAGDILISVETARRQSQGLLLNEVKILSLHGFLHLLGYEHKSENGEMERLENSLRKEFSLS